MVMTPHLLWSRFSPRPLLLLHRDLESYTAGMETLKKRLKMKTLNSELIVDLSFQADQKPSWNSIANLAQIRRRWWQQRQKCPDHEGKVRTTETLWWLSLLSIRWSPEHCHLAPGDQLEARHYRDHDYWHCCITFNVASFLLTLLFSPWSRGVYSEARETHCHEVTRNESHEVRDSDHEYLVPRPLSRGPSVTPQPMSRDSRDIERVMRQISLAVSRSRGVSSLSRAVGAKYAARDDLDTYTASLPRPKLKRLGSKEEKKQILRTKEASQKFNTEDKSRTKTLEWPKPDSRDKRGQRQRLRRTDTGARLDISLSRTQSNYYNLYGATVTSGKDYFSVYNAYTYYILHMNISIHIFK